MAIFPHLPRLRFAPLALLLAGIGLAGCEWLEPPARSMVDSPRDEAFDAWRQACPSESENAIRSTVLRAVGGDLSAIDCMILFERAVLTPYTEAQRQWRNALAGEELSEDTDIARSDLFQYLYVRWRLADVGLEQLEAHARTMRKADIDRALFLSRFDDGLLPGKRIDLCGRTAEDDPGFRFVMLGTGEREPASCGPAVADGRGAG